jgi:hypothetical protein
MEIPTERAFQILDSYCQHGTRLRFGGRISGEEAVSIAEVTHVWPTAQSITIKLYSDGDEKRRSWDIFVPLKGASFFTDPVLHAWFPDGTILVFAQAVN